MKFYSLFLLIFLVACSHNPLAQLPKDCVRKEVNAGMFRVLTLRRATDPHKPWVVYIEGDGYAWINRITPSPDPTPHYALALRLALLDKSPNVAYLARPCQYVKDDPACHKTYWTDRRFGTEVLSAMDEALDHIIGAQSVRLVGYSGGGTIAALLTAQRDDVLSLRTVAGNLDVSNFNRFHKVSKMPHALDPYDYAYKTRHVPQIHYVGTDDDIIPYELADYFLYAMKRPESAIIWSVSGATHSKKWEEVWPLLVSCFDSGTGPSSCEIPDSRK